MLLLEYSKIINPIIEIFQILNKSTFRVWVKEVNNMIKFIMIQMNAKYSVYIDPHVITAKGAHPKSVIDKETPVDSTKLFSASNIYNIPFSFRKCVTGYEFWGLLQFITFIF